jgi:hypothetical protein
MAISESDTERQARIQEDIRRLFARYRRASGTDSDVTPQTADDERSPRRASVGRFGPHTPPDSNAPASAP